MKNSQIKYLKHTYDSVIGLGGIGLILSTTVIVLGFLNIIDMELVRNIYTPLLVSVLGSILLLGQGIRLKNAETLRSAKKNLIILFFLCVLLIPFIMGKFLILLILLYTAIALFGVRSAIKKEDSTEYGGFHQP